MQKSKKLGFVTVVFLLGLLVIALGVFATTANAKADGSDYEVDKIPIEQVEIVSLNGRLLDSQNSIVLATNIMPEYAIATVDKIEYQVIWGNQLVNLNDNIVTAKDNTVGGEVQIKSVVDGIESCNTLYITVDNNTNDSFVPVEEVVINKVINHRRVDENSSYKLDELFSNTIIPANATQQNIDKVEVVKGADFAKIIGSSIVVKDNIPAGDLSFSVRAWAYGAVSNELEYSIYVPVKGITFSLDSQQMYTPQSKIGSSDTVSFNAMVSNANATDKVVKVFVERGAELIDGYDTQSEVELATSKFAIKKDLTHTLNKDSNRAIILRAVGADNVFVRISNIEIQVPVEIVELRLTGKLHRGEYTGFEPIYNGSSTAFVSDNPTISAKVVGVLSGSDITISTDDVLIDMNARTIQVPTRTAGYTEITIESWIYSDTKKTSVFVVESLKDTTVKAIFIDSMATNDGFVVQFGSDSSNVRLTRDERQLYIGRTTDVTVLYNNQPLSIYGLMLEKVELIDLNTMANTAKASVTIDKLAGIIKLTVNSSAIGSDSIGLKIWVRDGGFADVKLFDDTSNSAIKETAQDIKLLEYCVIPRTRKELSGLFGEVRSDKLYLKSLVDSGRLRITMSKLSNIRSQQFVTVGSGDES